MQERNGNLKKAIQPQSLKPIVTVEINQSQKENHADSGFHDKENKQDKSKNETSLVPAETNKIRKHYANKILEYELMKAPSCFRPEFLTTHNVSAEIRGRMVFLTDRLDDRSIIIFQLHDKHFLCLC